MRHVACCLAAGIVVTLAACRESTPVQPRQTGIQALIFDGAHSGNTNFFFLPPLVPDPSGSPNFVAGQFNPKLAPFVEVCQLVTDPRLDPNTDCLNSTRVLPATMMTLDAPDELYRFNWDTGLSGLVATNFYRIIVRGAPRGTVLGFVDVDPVLGGMKNLRTGSVVTFQDGRTLPIKVRIQNGAFGSTNATDFVEALVPNTSTSGATVITTNTGFAGASFPNGWLPTINGVQLDQVVVIIERVPVVTSLGQTCLSSGLQELEGCYRFRTDPDLHALEATFAQNVTVGLCFEVPSAIGHENHLPFVLHKREEFNGAPVGPTILLPEEPAPFVHCDTFTPTTGTIGAALRAGHIGAAARAGLAMLSHGVGRLIEPRALHAVDFGAGGNTDGFSRIGWAERDTMFVGPNVPTSAPAGSTIQATVQILAFHIPPQPVVGRLVTFTVTGPNGTLVDGNGNATNSLQVPTDATGNATVSWRLGPGPNTLQASANQVVDSPVLLAATGVAATLSGYQVLSSQVVTLPPGDGFHREAVACPTGTKVFGGGAAVVGEGSSNFHTRLQESGPGTIGGGAQDAWLVSIKNFDVAFHDIQIYAICGNPPAGYTVVSSADIPLASGAFTRQSATCPAGTKVFGGGVAVVGEGTADFNTRVQESGPATVNGGAQDIWLVSVKDTDAVSHTVRISAICANPPTGYQVVVSGDIALSDAAGGSPFNRQSVLCPVGLSILGGGAQVIGEGTADFDTRMGESSPGTIGGGAQAVWLASLTNDSGNPHTMAIRAVCATATGP